MGEDIKVSQSKLIVPLLPLRDVVLFPYMVVPLFVGREKSVHALEEALSKKKDVLLCSQKNAKTNDPHTEDYFQVGTLASIVQLLRLPDGTVKVLVEGTRRAHITKLVSDLKYLLVEVEVLEEKILSEKENKEIEALMRSARSGFERYIQLNKKIPPEVLMSVAAIENPGRLADTIAAHIAVKMADKQNLLEMVNPGTRLEKILAILKAEVEILQIEKKIHGRVKRQMEKSQREYYLNEQMSAIQKELGDKESEADELEKALRKKELPKHAKERAAKELKKLKMMSPMSAEATVVRNYIDWILTLPWLEYTEEKIDLDKASSILEQDHYGLEEVKTRVLEHLAVQKLTQDKKAPILCLVGPPGVGKTSLARSIAMAVGRNFVRTSLGGVRDEAEIRGHRRTYIGALPGKIIQSLKKAGSSNPVFLLDEIDKMSMDFRGDPSSAMLEVLDPEQNNAFNDHYLELDYDLSHVMFVTTANSVHGIPRPLLDRMELINLSGYTETEKLKIAQKHLIPKQIKKHGLDQAKIYFQQIAIKNIINKYTFEAGVRNLEREIANICRKVAKKIVEDHQRKKLTTVTKKAIYRFLGAPRYRYGKAEEEHEIGLTNGLCWTQMGGDLLSTEVTVVPGKGQLTLTGQLGSVMQESAKAAVSYARSRAKILGLEEDFYQTSDIHIHVAEGAVPKDGPSAGITMATSIVSALIQTPVNRQVAMTGEITLRGRVLPIGGLREKLLAAHRGGIKKVIIPKYNEKDLKRIPDKILKDLEIVAVSHMDEVLPLALILKKGQQLFNTVQSERKVLARRSVPLIKKRPAPSLRAH
ncbi:MAG: endopeptidase La [Deltaproteobacteria bacterium]|nr:endopeptidase La [Deltaproteobacteria bacterium]